MRRKWKMSSDEEEVEDRVLMRRKLGGSV